MAVITIDLEVPDNIIQMGGIELYAAKKGWKPTITIYETSVDENNQEITISSEVENTVSPVDYAKQYLRDFVKRDFREIYLGLKSAEDMASRSAEFESLFQ